jgi:hypothetical protein
MRSRFALGSVGLVAAGLLGAAASTSAFAQAQGLLDNRFVFNLGAFVLGTDVKGNLNGKATGSNNEVDFDRDFGKAGDASRPRFDALWRINPKHHLRFLYFDNETTRNKVIDRDIAWGDYTFTAGGNVESKVKYEVYELAYEYAFMRTPSYEVAASFGIHNEHFNTRLTGNATITDANGNVTQKNGATESNSVSAPLPVIGLRGGWVVAPQWYLDGQLQLFKVNVNGIDGNWTDLRLGGTWMFHKNFGVGLGYNRFYTHVDVKKSNFDGNLKFGYQGVQAYLTGTF